MNNFINNLKQKNFFFFFFMAILVFFFFYKLSPFDSMNSYTLTYYAINYDNGLISRGLIGEIFLLLGLTTKTEVVIANIFIIFSLMFFISYVLNMLVKKYNNYFILIALLFIINTGSFTFMYSYLELGRLDIYIYILGILSLLCINKKKLFLIPIFSIIGMLIHESYLIWLSPMICMVLLYEYSNTKEKNYLKTFIINIIVLLSMFIVVRFIIFTPNFNSSNEFINYLNIKSSLDIDPAVINDYYYSTSQGNRELIKTYTAEQNILDYIIAIVGYILIIIIGLKTCFIKLYKKSKNKLIFILMMLSTVSPSILFFILCDYGRWYMFLINTFLLLMMYLFFANKDNKKITKQKVLLSIIMSIVLLIMITIVFFPERNFHLIKYGKTDTMLNIVGQITK